MTVSSYTGVVTHRRHPTAASDFVSHRFRYAIEMSLTDLSNPPLPSRRDQPRRTWSPSDFGASTLSSLRADLAELIEESGLERPRGRILQLAQWRTLGVSFNPLVVYYCYNASNEKVESLVLEVRNTPWGERHRYVVDGATNSSRFEKLLHVSPFLGMDHDYELTWSEPGENIVVHLTNWRESERIFDAHLSLHQQPSPSLSPWWHPARHPMGTVYRIYLQAIKLRIRGAHFYPHPRRDQ